MRVDRTRLIFLMAKKDMKTNELSNASGVSRATISAVRGGKSCTYETATKLAKALNVPLSDIAEE